MVWITTLFTRSGTPESGLSPIVDVWDIDSDTQVIINQSMIEIGTTGFYKYNFSSFNENKNYLMLADGGTTLLPSERYKDNSSIQANILERLETKTDDIITLVTRSLGLIHENHFTDQYVYDVNGLLESCRFRIYNDNISVGTSLNVIATYLMEANYNNGLLTTYKVIKQ